MRAAKAGALYFLVVFAAGWVFGPIRVLWLAPRVGAVLAELVEAPLMLIVMIVAARRVARRMAVDSASGRAIMGLTAFGLVMAAELLIAAPLRGQSPAQYFEGMRTLAGAISIAMFAVFAAVPSIVGRDRRAGAP